MAPTPGAPLAGLQRPLARAAPIRASRANWAPGSHRAHLATRVPESQSPELIEPRRSRRVPGLASGLGRTACYLFALPEVKPAGPPALPAPSAETVRPRVDRAALRALFGIVCTDLSAVARPARLGAVGVSGKSAPGARLLGAPRPQPRTSQPVLGRGRAAGLRAAPLLGPGHWSAECRGADRR